MSLLTRAHAETQDETHTLFGQVMWLMAGEAGLFTLGSYLGRHLSGGFAFVFFILAFVCLIAMNFTARSQLAGGSTVLLGGVGCFLGLAMAPTISYYAAVNPRALWQAGGATALFMLAAGAAGYATRSDLSGVGSFCWWALLALIIFGVVMIFVNIPAGALIYSILGLVIFAGLTMFDFQRLRVSKDMDSAPLIAASIFLDFLNVFLFFLQLFSGRSRD